MSNVNSIAHQKTPRQIIPIDRYVDEDASKLMLEGEEFEDIMAAFQEDEIEDIPSYDSSSDYETASGDEYETDSGEAYEWRLIKTD
jgi:hypothetical protein|tara:strand:- start:107 stop:364 length:258 start_codon:yes stop_codon:yes gene_type:complete